LPERALAPGQTSILAGFRMQGRNIGGSQIFGPHIAGQHVYHSLWRGNGTTLAILHSCEASILWAPDSVPS